MQKELENFPQKLPKLIVITGPTGVGKTAIAIYIAQYIKKNFKNVKGAEIISADSRQIYKDIPIGSNYPTKKELKTIPHHFVGIKDIKQKFDITIFQKNSLKIINKIWKENKIPIICGGNWFYIQAVIDGIIFPEVKPDEKLRKMLEKKEIDELLSILRKIDYKRYQEIDKNNKRRIIRSIEIASKLGSVPHLQKKPLPAKILIIGIKLPKEKLKEIIKKRTKKMIKKGLIQETKKLTKKISYQKIKELGFEYQAVLEYLNKKIKTKEKLEEKINQGTMKYIKRQMTWFKKEKRIKWIKNKDEALQKVITFLKI